MIVDNPYECVINDVVEGREPQRYKSRKPTRGEDILKNAGDPARQDFYRLFVAFVEYGNMHQWRWQPGSPGRQAGTFLDSWASKGGECDVFASNLAILAFAKPPLGLGISPAMIRKHEYTGEHHRGFVSDHYPYPRLALIASLSANVFTPVTPQRARNNLYLWENHKVLEYRVLFYDPSYGKTFRRLNDMANYHLTDEEKTIGKHHFLVAKNVVEKKVLFRVTSIYRKVSVTGKFFKKKTKVGETYHGPFAEDGVTPANPGGRG